MAIKKVQKRVVECMIRSRQSRLWPA